GTGRAAGLVARVPIVGRSLERQALAPAGDLRHAGERAGDPADERDVLHEIHDRTDLRIRHAAPVHLWRGKVLARPGRAPGKGAVRRQCFLAHLRGTAWASGTFPQPSKNARATPAGERPGRDRDPTVRSALSRGRASSAGIAAPKPGNGRHALGAEG